MMMKLLIRSEVILLPKRKIKVLIKEVLMILTLNILATRNLKINTMIIITTIKAKSNPNLITHSMNSEKKKKNKNPQIKVI